MKTTLKLLKETLGRIRGKYRGVAGNDLPVETDWSELLSEGIEEQSKLEETINNRGDWVAPLVG